MNERSMWQRKGFSSFATLTLFFDAGATLGPNERIPSGSGSLIPSDSGSLTGGTLTTDLPDYNSLLNVNGSGLMGRLKIDAIGVDLPIYHGTSDATLFKGIGHLEGTSLPIGGESTHSVLTGHRGLAEATLFTNLDKVGIGDQFTIEIFGEVLTYQVISTEVVDPKDTESLGVVRGKDLVTLVTCTPLGINSQRILVTGQRVTPTPAEAIKEAGVNPHILGFPWWAVWLFAGTVAMMLYLWRSGFPSRSHIDGPVQGQSAGNRGPQHKRHQSRTITPSVKRPSRRTRTARRHDKHLNDFDLEIFE